MKKIWFRKAHSFAEERKFDTEYYLSMSAREKIETMQFLRELYFKFHRKDPTYERRKGLRRVVKIVQQV